MHVRRGHPYLTIVFALLALWPLSGHCQEVKVDLAQALTIALEGNREIRAFRNAVSAEKESVGIARSHLLPKIFFEERAARTNNPPSVFMMKLNQQRFTAEDFALNSLNNPKATTDYQTSFSFEQPVFVMRSFLGLNAARLEYSAKNEDFIRKKEEVSLNVARAYLRAQTAREYLRAAEKGLEDAQEHVRIASVRYKHGVGLYSDCLRTQTTLTEAEQRNVSARKDLAVAKRWLGVLLGRPESVDISEEPVSLTTRDMDYYLSASASRRDIAAMRIRHETAKTGIRLAESRYLPYVGVGGSYQYNDHAKLFGSEGDSWQLMAFLRWDLFDGLNRESERRKAQYQMTETGERLKGLEEFVAFKIQESYLAVEEAKKNVELSLSALKTAEEGRRLVKSRYENSLSPLVDLLDVQVNLNRARASAVARQNDYQMSIISLSYESGTILKDLGME